LSHRRAQIIKKVKKRIVEQNPMMMIMSKRVPNIRVCVDVDVDDDGDGGGGEAACRIPASSISVLFINIEGGEDDILF